MKKLVSLIVFMVILVLNQTQIEASAKAVTAEKVWTVSLNTGVLNTPDNLAKIQVENSNGEVLPINVTVNEKDARLLEVKAESSYALNETYTLTIPVGFESTQGLQITEEKQFIFTVDSQITTSSLSGEWSTKYMYNGTVWNITAIFSNGNVQLYLNSGPTTHKGLETYEINDGWMLMEVEDLSLNLNGQLQVYNDMKFKIVTKSGKVAYFDKVQ